MPRRLYSTATHEDYLVDPDDTYMLDNVVRFVGQRVAAVVAETEGAAEDGCRLLEVEYEVLPAVFDPEEAMRPGAPVLHDKGERRRNEATSTSRSTARSAASRTASPRRTSSTRRPTPPRACSTSTWRRTARSPGATRTGGCMSAPARRRRSSPSRSSATCSACRPRDVHVFTERVGGGFGGKQEMLTEDLCVLAALKTGRPVKWEFTREEQFIAATTRHPMTTRVKLGAKRDGTLTAIELRVVSNTGAYGGHAGETLAASLGSPLTAYRCPNKKADGYAVYTNMVPAGGFRGYGASQTTFAIECAMDELARTARHGPVRDPPQATWSGRATGSNPSGQDPTDVDFGSYGLDQCMDLVEAALASGRRCGQAGRRRLAGRHRHRAGDAGMRPADRASLRGAR